MLTFKNHDLKKIQVEKNISMKSCMAKLKWRTQFIQLIVSVNKIVQFWQSNDGFPVFILVIWKENIPFLDSISVFVLGSKLL